MAYAPDRVPPPGYPESAPHYATTPPSYAPATDYPTRYDERPYDAHPMHEPRSRRLAGRGELDHEVTAGPFRFGFRHGVLGILALFAALGLVLGLLGFAAAFALDEAADEARDGDGGNTAEDAAAGASALPAILVSLLPFLAAPVLALGCGAWAGHASRDSRIGMLSGAVGGFLGPIALLLITGIGFALGAGAANLNLEGINVPWGVAPGWGTTIPYLFTGAGLLWLIANALSGALGGGIVGALLDGRWSTRSTRRAYARRTTRY